MLHKDINLDREITPDEELCQSGNFNSIESCLLEADVLALQEVFESYGDKIACMIIEPVIGAGGCFAINSASFLFLIVALALILGAASAAP